MFDRTLEILHKMASDKNKSKRELFPNVSIANKTR